MNTHTNESFENAHVNLEPETNPFRMNLQLFAAQDLSDADSTDPNADPNAEPSAPQEGGKAPQTSFTLEEVMRMVQAEADKRVTSALKKQEKAFEKKMSLSGLDEQQRAIAERDQQIAEQNELIRNLTIAQNKAELAKTLAGRGLPLEFADVIEVGDDAQAAQQKVDALDTAFKRAIEEAVNQRLAGGSLPGRGASKGATMSKEQIMAIKDPTERQRAIEKNMNLFMKGR